MIDAYFEGDGDRYVATQYTRGPWDPTMQHGGPPSALLGTLVSRREAVEGQRIARLTFEILRPVPIGPLRVSTRVARPGRRVSMVEGVLTDDDGQELMLVRGWRIAPTPKDLPVEQVMVDPGPETGFDAPWFFEADDIGFEKSVEVKFLEGGFLELGPSRAWFRARVQLIAGQPIDPIARVLIAADCSNGISNVLDYKEYLFVNPDLAVVFSREPVGEWVCLDAQTILTPAGVTTSRGRLADQQGHVASASQTLFVQKR